MNTLKRVFLFTTLLIIITIGVMMVQSSSSALLDFGSFAASGINLARGINPYDSSSHYIFEVHFPVIGAGGRLPNLNPPITLLFFEVITEQNLIFTLNFWRAFSFILYIATIFFLVQKHKTPSIQFVWALSLAGFWHTIELGQIYIPLLVLTVLIWLFTAQGKFGMAGLFLGLLVSIKPNFLIWVLILFAVKNWRMGLSAAITMLIVGLIPFLLYGYKIYAQWLEVIGVSENILAMPGNSSIHGFLSRVGLSSLSMIISMLLFAISIFHIVKQNQKSTIPIDKNTINAIGLLVSLLVSPISWAGYSILLLPMFLSNKDWSQLAITSAIILSIPFPLVLLLYNSSPFAAFLSGFAYTLPLALSLAEKFRQLLRPSAHLLY